jgi:hypothetical protein
LTEGVSHGGLMRIGILPGTSSIIETRELAEGDVIILLAGGHGFGMLEDTVLFEVEQGPYTGLDEKERF